MQLPFLQTAMADTTGKDLEYFRVVPIAVGTRNFEPPATRGGLGRSCSNRARAKKVLIVASSDMNHYEPDEITRVKDRKPSIVCWPWTRVDYGKS